MIIIFTGNGKGKTTAALGQAIRAIGQGKRVLMIQFIKGPFISGEQKFFKKFQIPRPEGARLAPPSGGAAKSKFQIIAGGKGFVKILGDQLPFKEHKKAAQKTWQLAKKVILGKKYNLVILDEINIALHLKLLSENDILNLLKKVPENIDLILTGRFASKNLIKLADVVTEMKEIKYPKGIGGYVPKRGIEF